jgi:hypothetical protein
VIILSYVLIGYLAGVCLTAARLGWHMAFRLDRFDWHYAKSDNWLMFIFATILWPLMLKMPEKLLNPSKLFDGNYGMASRKREEARLWDNPPPCGAHILYRQDYSPDAETFGEFTFRRVDVENCLTDKLRAHPHLEKDHEGAILNWLRQHDDSVTKPTAVPVAWGRFEFIAVELLRARCGEVRCLKCEKPIPISQVSLNEDWLADWVFNRFVCPCDHPLLVVRGMHLHLPSS